MKVIVAYNAEGPGLPVAVEDTCAAMARRLGLQKQAVYRLLKGQRIQSKMNALSMRLVLHYVEIDEEDKQ